MSEIYIEEDVRTVFNILNNAGFECFMVGGCVRDFLLDKKPNDIDFATNATPGEIEECFYGFNLIKMFQTKQSDAKKNQEYVVPESGWEGDGGFNVANAAVKRGGYAVPRSDG